MVTRRDIGKIGIAAGLAGSVARPAWAASRIRVKSGMVPYSFFLPSVLTMSAAACTAGPGSADSSAIKANAFNRPSLRPGRFAKSIASWGLFFSTNSVL